MTPDGTQALSPLVQVTGMVLTFLGTIATSFIGYLIVKLNHKTDDAALQRRRASDKQDEAAAKVDEVKIAATAATQHIAQQLSAIKAVGDMTHGLVNSGMTVQLQISAVALRRVADLTKHPDDVAAADIAEEALTAKIKSDRSSVA